MPPDFWCCFFGSRRVMFRHGAHLRESGDARADGLEEGDGQLMLHALRDGRVMDSFARGAYGDGPPVGWRSALRKRNRSRAARRKVTSCASGLSDRQSLKRVLSDTLIIVAIVSGPNWKTSCFSALKLAGRNCNWESAAVTGRR